MTPSEDRAAQKSESSCPPPKVKYGLSRRGTRNLVTQKTPENQFSSVTRQLPFMPVLYPLIHKRVGLQRPLASY